MRQYWVIGLGLAAAIARGTTPLGVPGDDWRFADVARLIESRAREGKPFRSPDELLSAFPDGMRNHFTFVFQTRNRFQDASPLHPRAIVFNRNLIYTFNGHPRQRGYDTIEMMEFRRDEKRLELREIAFESHEGKREAKISAANPAKCAECHGTRPKPIWSEYSNWPGVYGSNDDHLRDEELANYRRFQAEIKSDPKSRYAKLVFPAGSDLSPYEPTEFVGGDAFRINLLFTKLLVRFNSYRLVGDLEQSPYYPAYRWVLPAATDGTCEHHYHTVTDKIEKRLSAQLDKLLRRHPLNRAAASYPLRDRLLLALGVPPTRFSMAPAGRYEFEDGTLSQNLVFAAVQLETLAGRPEASGKLTFNHDYHSGRYGGLGMYRWDDELGDRANIESCEWLLQQAEQGMDAFDRLPPQPETASFEESRSRAEALRASPAIPVSCVYCHSVESEAPRFSFHDPAALRAELTADGGRLLTKMLERASPHAADNVRMPPASFAAFGALSEGEFRELAEYLNQVVRGMQ